MGKVFDGAIFTWLVWAICCVNTEFTYMPKGYLFTKAFKAKTTFQHFFTHLHKDAHPVDGCKLTYMGYICSIISTVVMLTAAVISLYYIINGRKEFKLFIWSTISCSVLNILGILIKSVDGGLCLLINKVKSRN